MLAYVPAGFVPFLFVVIRVLNPTDVAPLYSGWGLVILRGCAGSLAAG
jgi:hypothetical protein